MKGWFMCCKTAVTLWSLVLIGTFISGRAEAQQRERATGVIADGVAHVTPHNATLDPRLGMLYVRFRLADPERVAANRVRTGRGDLVRVLAYWYTEGTAAGNIGDLYDNRDGGHSGLSRAAYPQLSFVQYSEAMKARQLHWGLQTRLLFNLPTVGNSSTAGSGFRWRSNARAGLTNERGMLALCAQYAANHVYVYPEHKDQDPGHNGKGGGYGDVFPANCPYYVVSQGSSLSDKAHVHALLATMAALRPDVKKALVNSGQLAPTLQMIMRACSTRLEQPEDYLTGRAHPTAFRGDEIDALKMVRMAHAIEPGYVPPVVALKLIEEDVPLLGRDFFAPGRSEVLFNTPAAIARVVRATRRTRRMVVSAEGSTDLYGHPLNWHWAVLRGDPQRIRINPLDEAGRRVEILVDYHERRPVEPGSDLESNRVDIGAFVHNGEHYSAPAFVSLYYPDSEARTYAADGRILEVDYEAGNTRVGHPQARFDLRSEGYDVRDWPAMLDLIVDDGEDLSQQLLRAYLKEAHLAALRRLAGDIAPLIEADAAAEKASQEANQARLHAGEAAAEAREAVDQATAQVENATQQEKAQAEATLDAARAALAAVETRDEAAQTARSQALRALRQARSTARDAFVAEHASLGGSVKSVIEAALNGMRADTNLYPRNAAAFDTRAVGDELWEDFRKERALLERIGLLVREGPGHVLVQSVLDGEAGAGPLTAFERRKLELLNLSAMGALYEWRFQHRYTRNYTDPVIYTQKNWRDVYRYDSKRRLIGWTRWRGEERDEFTRDGALVHETDDLGRAKTAFTVRYRLNKGRSSVSLEYEPADVLLHYEYASGLDELGAVMRREPVDP